MLGLMCSGCLWNRLTMVPATRFFVGIGSYYDAESCLDDVLVPLCDECGKDDKSLDFDSGFDRWIEQEKLVHARRTLTTRLPAHASHTSCKHSDTEGISFIHLAPADDMRLVEQCKDCRGIRFRMNRDSPWSGWQSGDLRPYRQIEAQACKAKGQ